MVRRTAALAAATGLIAPAGALADYALNLRPGVTPISREVYDLHMLILWICVAIGAVVFGAMVYSIIRHRKSRGVEAARFHENTSVEILWTLIPVLILVSMAIPATRTLIAMEDTRDADLTIKVTGYQWKWHYDYLGEDVSFFSTLATPPGAFRDASLRTADYLLEVDNPVVVPVGRKVRFLTTANDVIHSWWVPDLGWKRDAIPGFINESWAQVDVPGVYRGQCAELCGKDHGFMPVVLVAKSEPEYEAWLAQQKSAKATRAAAAEKTWTLEELMQRGGAVYAKTCAVCHQANGEGVPGAFPPLAAGHPFAAGENLLAHLRERGFLDADGNIVLGPLEQHIDIVLNGIEGSAMQAFRDQLDDADLAAVITYERNSFGNDSGELVQPAAVKAAR
ncbi:MAG: cytochrome c oxidase subunit II [Gammaproteobacteria bacterium]|nr:cytochrome c oxidase subunit II [Gammaproteobacteria bacterium]